MKAMLVGGLTVFAVLGMACGGPKPAAAPTAQPIAIAAPEPTPTAVPSLRPTPAPTATVTPGPTPATVRTRRDKETAIDFSLDLLTGEELRLSELQGKLVVLNFWGSWCPPCRAEMPSFESIYREYKDKGVVFVGVAVSDVESKARAFAEKVGVTYPIGLDPGHISSTYRITAMPTTYFIDQEGNISRKLQGPANEGALRFFIDSRLP